MMTATFSTFSLHLDLLPSTQPVQPRIRSVHSTFTKMSHLPIRTLHPFVASLPTFSSSQGRVHNSADLKKKLYFFGGVENYVFSHLRSGRQTTIPLFPCTIQYSTPRRAANKPFILKCSGFSLTSPVNDGSPPTLSHSNWLLCHLPDPSAKPSARREGAPAKVTQH